MFMLRSYFCLPLFNAELVNERWTVEYYKTLSHTRFPPWQANDKCTNLNVALSEVPPETKKATLTQAQKYRNLLKTNQLVSAGSEGGMKFYRQRLSVLQKILQNWLISKDVQLKGHDSDSEEPFQDEDNFTILNDNIKSLLDVEMSKAVKNEAITSPGSNSNLEEKEEESTMKIVMPPKIIKRGRPKGAEVTVIGLTSQKKPNLGTKKRITCFS